MLCIEAEYKDKKEYLYLPDKPMSITKALHRLGAEKPEDCTYQVEDFNVDSKEWRERFERMVQSENIFDVNAVVKKINDADMELDKLEGVVKYTGDDSAKVIAKLAEHINNFTYISEVGSYGELGKHVIQNYLLDDLPKRFEECIDYETCGEIFADEVKGKFLNGGFVYMSEGKSLEDILSDADMRMGEIQ